jgi:hypothetical protein
LKKLSLYPFLINSSEFQIFARSHSDVEKSLNEVPKINLADVHNMKFMLEVNDEILASEKLNEYD